MLTVCITTPGPCCGPFGWCAYAMSIEIELDDAE